MSKSIDDHIVSEWFYACFANWFSLLRSCFVFCSVSFHWSRDRKQASWCSQSRGNFFFYLQLKNLQFDLIIDNTLVTAMWTLHNWLTCIIDYHSKEVQSENSNFFIILEIICRYTVVIFHELCHFNKYLPSFIPLILYFKICKWVAFKKCFKKTFLYMCYCRLPMSCNKHVQYSVQIF